jgi:hypothetical protein
MADISREELAAFTEAHTKSAVAMEKITDALENLTKNQDKLLDKMTNGMSDSIIGGVTANYDSTQKSTVECLERIESAITSIPSMIDDKIENSSISRDAEHTKWLVGIIGFVIIVCVVIMRVIGNDNTSKVVSTQTAVLEELLKQHMKESVVK